MGGNPLRFTDPFGLEAVTNEQRFYGRPVTTLDILGFALSLTPKLILMCSNDQAGDDDLPNEDNLSDKISEIADKTGLSPKEVRDSIHKAKTNLPKGTNVRNPDVKVDTTTGEVFPQTSDGGIGDSIGNVFD